MKRFKHNLSHYRLLTGDMGELLPIGLVEVLPGDTLQHATRVLIRASPLATPPMHPVNVRVHHWFVPFRLLWEDWEKFITGGPDGMDASSFPTCTPNVTEGSIGDYLGAPVMNYAGKPISAMPFRAYALVFNEWYRDQDLMTAMVFPKSGGNDPTGYSLASCAWEKDYFTTARPWERKGPAVTLPLGTTAPVITTGQPPVFQGVDGDPVSSKLQFLATPSTTPGWTAGRAAANANDMAFVTSGLQADLTAATAVNVNVVRQAFALQRFEEARARYGSRYTEYLRYLGVRSSDARLQRPEYLGGGRQALQFSEVLQTASTTADGNGVGQLYGHGISALRSNRYRRFFEEHGFVLSLAHVLPRTMYPQGLSRIWNRRVNEDFWQKELQHIGQQPILNKEVYAPHATPDGVFGYQDRYDEYRRMESTVHGEFRSTLNDWHFARIFGADPTLNSAFVTANPAKRPFQSTSTDVLLMLAHHQVVARRMVAGVGSSFIF